jgi:hypothetical protein
MPDSHPPEEPPRSALAKVLLGLGALVCPGILAGVLGLGSLILVLMAGGRGVANTGSAAWMLDIYFGSLAAFALSGLPLCASVFLPGKRRALGIGISVFVGLCLLVGALSLVGYLRAVLS